jgi:outer membrane protein OmpA-like peptidoglycan-associated protein
MAAQIREHGAGEVVIAANGENEALAFDRAKAVRDALLAKLDPALAQATTVSLRTDLADPRSTLLALGESPVLGTVLFDTDSATIKPGFAPVIAKIAADIEKLGGGVVGVIGHADRRCADAYNVKLGLRRAKAVYEAIAATLGAQARSRLRVDINDDPTAPVGLKSR